jgi:hypothetical protein
MRNSSTDKRRTKEKSNFSWRVDMARREDAAAAAAVAMVEGAETRVR